MNTPIEDTQLGENPSSVLQLPYMPIPIGTAIQGILAIGEPGTRIKDAFLLPTLTAAIQLRAKWKATASTSRTWLVFDFDGDLTPRITQLCHSLGLTDEIAECGAADDTTMGQLAGRIAIFNWTNPTSKSTKDERLTRRVADAGGTLHNHSKANVANNALELIQQERANAFPAMIFSDRLLYPTRVANGSAPGTTGATRDSNRRWPEPWQVARQVLFTQANCMVVLAHTHLIPLPEEDADFPFYDLVKTKYIWRCQHAATSRKVKDWASLLDPKNPIAENATYHLESGRSPWDQFPGQMLRLAWEHASVQTQTPTSGPENPDLRTIA